MIPQGYSNPTASGKGIASIVFKPLGNAPRGGRSLLQKAGLPRTLRQRKHLRAGFQVPNASHPPWTLTRGSRHAGLCHPEHSFPPSWGVQCSCGAKGKFHYLDGELPGDH